MSRGRKHFTHHRRNEEERKKKIQDNQKLKCRTQNGAELSKCTPLVEDVEQSVPEMKQSGSRRGNGQSRVTASRGKDDSGSVAGTRP
ncbi:hypothetical protein RRG08_008624 [Elysia crispata]|uniref:Uncharacterized protein n=1 Tax=Elysia crispata TaxID=231223 RepID=A0AAE1B783_9GAST|nr:hypothetical protein RRG08_008624 [Elysia crispata]